MAKQSMLAVLAVLGVVCSAEAWVSPLRLGPRSHLSHLQPLGVVHRSLASRRAIAAPRRLPPNPLRLLARNSGGGDELLQEGDNLVCPLCCVCVAHKNTPADTLRKNFLAHSAGKKHQKLLLSKVHQVKPTGLNTQQSKKRDPRDKEKMELHQELCDAAVSGNEFIVQDILEEAAEKNLSLRDVKDKKGISALEYAVAHGHTECAKLLVPSRVIRDLRHQRLFTACCTGDADDVKMLLSEGCEVNTRDKEGWSPLHHAAACGHTSVVDLLLDSGADKTAVITSPASAHHDIGSGYTALYVACMNGHHDTVLQLLNRMHLMQFVASPKYQPHCFRLDSLWMSRAAWRHTNVACVLDDFVKQYLPQLPLWVSLEYWDKALDEGLISCNIHDFETMGIDTRVEHMLRTLEKQDSDSNGTALHRAAREGRFDDCRTLLLAGANKEADHEFCSSPGDHGTTWHFNPLHEAILHNHTDIMRLLLLTGAEMNSGLSWHKVRISEYHLCQFSPLQLASALGNAQAVRILLDAGAKVACYNSDEFEGAMFDRESPLRLKRSGLIGFGTSALCLAAEAGFPHIVQLLVNFGAEMHAPAEKHSFMFNQWLNPLWIATMAGNADVIRTLTSLGADVNEMHNSLWWSSYWVRGKTSLLLFAVDRLSASSSFADRSRYTIGNRKESVADVVKALLEANADPNLDDGPTTPLLLAIHYLDPGVVGDLLNAGADTEYPGCPAVSHLVSTVCVRQYNGRSGPDHWRCASEILKALVAAGANVLATVSPDDDNTPWLDLLDYMDKMDGEELGSDTRAGMEQFSQELDCAGQNQRSVSLQESDAALLNWSSHRGSLERPYHRVECQS